MVRTVLIYECAGGHGECLPSYYEYFKELDFKIDFILDKKVFEDKPLWMLNNLNIFKINTPAIENDKHIKEVSLIGDKLFSYDFYFIATLNKHTYPFVEYLLKSGIDTNKILFQNHLNTEYFLKNSNNNTHLIKNGFVLTKSPDFPSLPPIKNNCNKFKNKIEKPFNSLNILITGLDKIHFEYFEKFVKVVDKLNKENKSIKINVTGIRRRGNYNLPKSENVNYCGRVNFEELTNLYVSNDFLMTFFDKNNTKFKEEHHSFLKGRVSGSRNMSIIYGIPLLVQEPYQKAWNLNDNNSISYENTNYESLLLSLFNIKPEYYNNIIDNLLNIQKQEVDLCIKNLKNKIEFFEYKNSLPDLVYIVKKDEKNEDLRYSLRSVEKFVPHNKIWIVGYKPSWVTNVEYLPVIQNGNKWNNSITNILAACNCTKISKEFILMNDDFFAIKPISNLLDSINVSLGLLQNAVNEHEAKKSDSAWGKAFKYVNELLKDLNIEEPYYNYESHTPLLINKQKYLEVMNLPKVQKFMKTSKVLHKRSLYRNIDKLKPEILSKDVKILQHTDDTLERIKICDWLSVYDGQVGNPSFKDLNTLLRTLFASCSEYEFKNKTKTKSKDKFVFGSKKRPY